MAPGRLSLQFACGVRFFGDFFVYLSGTTLPMMRKLRLFVLFALLTAALCGAVGAKGQIYAKLNGLYALAGVVNPAVEFTVAPRSTVQVEIVASPWKSIDGKHATFGIFMAEYRRYFRGHNDGWYLGGNLGMMAFDLSKPYVENWAIRFENRYSKGYGMMIGLCVGFEKVFRERWVVDAYFGWAWMDSYYNGYSLDGQIDMYPHRPVQPAYPDPFNGSSEWYPNKVGVSIGYRIFDPDRRKGH